MTAHYASRDFRAAYDTLPEAPRKIADKNFELLKRNPQHPSFHCKPVGRFWSVRVGLDYRAVARPVDDGFLWFWIGTHA